MPEILFISPGPIEFASARMRAYWVSEHMDADVIEYSEIIRQNRLSPAYEHYIFGKTASADVAKFLIGLDKKVWWDLCDPVHWFSPKEARNMAVHMLQDYTHLKTL